MLVKGKFNSAIVFNDKVEQEAVTTLRGVLDQEIFKNSNIRVMSDCHNGKGCVIGFTAKGMGKNIVPNLLGADLSCGVIVVNLGYVGEIDFEKFDNHVRDTVPMGFNRANNQSNIALTNKLRRIPLIDVLINKLGLKFSDVLNQVGTLGSGNHFCELNKINGLNDIYLVIHSGSRGFGNNIAKYHQKLAEQYIRSRIKEENDYKNKMIGLYKQQGRESEIENLMPVLTHNLNKYNVPKDLCFLEGKLATEYLEDCKIAHEFAKLNRETMARNIVKYFGLDLDDLEYFHTVHNYMDAENDIIRKGAVSAKLGEKLIIPMNMRDGSILAIGKCNDEWNQSAPHGAGRLMSRTKAKELVGLDEFKSSMENVYSSTVNLETLDESPMAYKPMEEILSYIGDTVEVVGILKPIYNIKGI